jgi:putative ABC transport system permease protein
MGTAIEGLHLSFLRTISFIGADVLYVQLQDWAPHSRLEWQKMQRRRPLTLDQVGRLQPELSTAQAVAPVMTVRETLSYGKQSASGVSIVGTTEEFLFTGGVSLDRGRFFSSAEAAGGRPVCLLGSLVATNLFHGESPLGRKIKINQQPLEVIGVLEQQGTFLSSSMDNQAIIPLPQLIASYRNSHNLDQIQVKVKPGIDLEDAKDELHSAFRKIRHLAPGQPDDFAINQQDQVLQLVQKVTGTIAAIGLFITGLSLFVGGIGIMNIMFVSVAERTREIGVRKAIGAKQRTILLQFLIEAATLCFLGGMIGLGIAWPLTLLMQRVLPASMSLDVAGIALLVSLLTGVISGIFPAWRAARMDPVEALRNE